MELKNGLKWGLIFGVIVGLIVAIIVYGVIYFPHLPTLQKEMYNLTFNEILNKTKGNVTKATLKATLAEKELPTMLPLTVLLVYVLTYSLFGAIGGMIIAYIWEKNPSWITKGLIGGAVILVLSLLLAGIPLIVTVPTSLLIGLLISYKLNAINGKV